MSTAKYAIELTLSGGAAVGGAIRGVVGAISGIGGALASANRNVFYFAQNLVGLGRTAAGIAGKGIDLGSALIGPIAELEAAQIQFRNLLGSAEAARAHIQSILDSPISSAFDDADVLAGSRTLMLFGGEALGAGKNLQMVADLAAASGSKFESAASAVGKLFANVKTGEGAGDAARAFKTMGISLGDLDEKLDAMTKSGATADAMWKTVTDRFTRFAGVSDEMAGTMAGLRNSIVDSWAQIKRTTGAPLFGLVKSEMATLAAELNTQLGSERFNIILTGAGAALADFVAKARDTLTGGITLDDLVAAAETGKLAAVLGEQISNLAGVVSDKALALGRSLGAEIARGIGEAVGEASNNLLNKFGSTKAGQFFGVQDYSAPNPSQLRPGVPYLSNPVSAPPTAPASPVLARLRAGEFEGQTGTAFRALEKAAAKITDAAREQEAAAARTREMLSTFEGMAAQVGRF